MRLPRCLAGLPPLLALLAVPASAQAATPRCTGVTINGHMSSQPRTVDLTCADSDSRSLHVVVDPPKIGSVQPLSDDGEGHVRVQWTPPPGTDPGGGPGLPLVTTVDLFSYHASDDDHHESKSAPVRAFLEDQRPACKPVSASTPHAKAVGVTLPCTDPDGDPIGYSVVIPPAPTKGSVTVPDAQGHVTFTPAKGFVGEVKFRFKATDGGGSDEDTATVDVNDRAPTCVDPGEQELPRDVPFAMHLTCSDPDGEPVTVVASGPSYGSLGPFTPSGTTFTATYTPSPGYVGADAFTFWATDGDATTVPITVPLLLDGFGHAKADPRATAAVVLDSLKLGKKSYGRKTGRLRLARVAKGQLPPGSVLRLKLIRKSTAFGQKTIKVGPGSTPVSVRLGKVGRRYVFPRKRVTLRVEFRIIVPGGHVVRDYCKVTLKGKPRPKHRHHRKHG